MKWSKDDKLLEMPEWKALVKHYQVIKSVRLKDLFKSDPNRFKKFSQIFKDEILIDYSKHLISDNTLELLLNLVKASYVENRIIAMYNGEKINWTENWAALHIALRNMSNLPIYVDSENIMPKISTVLLKMKDFSEKIRTGEWKGFTGKRINTVINIGIGGSYLGPEMICEALKPYSSDILKVRFISNIDGTDFCEKVKDLNPERTLFIVSSKTFTTQETMTNAFSAKNWLLNKLKNESSIKNHFVAVSTNIQLANSFGIPSENIFEFWDWVGGRYSWASSIGLSVVCFIGYDNFYELLNGAHEMDNHFKETSFEKNIPVILAMINIWYNNFFGSETLAVLPYDQYLYRLPAYLQQLEMESNGKFIDKNGNPVDYQTSQIIWGEPGTNGQHAFFQLLHQGTKLVPADFIACVNSHNNLNEHQPKLISNFFAQTKALMIGKSLNEVRKELEAQGLEKHQIEILCPHRSFLGNRPSTTILIKKLTPRNLGRLIAMYEMKVFVEGCIWRINSFDQWGVELGKSLAKNLLFEVNHLTNGKHIDISHHDSSTRGLLDFFSFANEGNQK